MQPAAQQLLASSPTSPAGDAALPVLVVAVPQRQIRLTQLLTARGLVVCARAHSAEQVTELVAEHRPRVIVLDLAPSAGLAVVEQVMARCPLPILLTGAAAQDPGEALAAGAVEAVAVSAEEFGSAAFGDALSRQLVFASRVRVITHPRGRLRDRAQVRRQASQDSTGPSPAANCAPSVRRSGTPLPVVAIGASTGGPPALAAVLGALPVDLPAAVLVVQHMAEGFVASLAAWLDAAIALPVAVAVDGQRLRAGQVLLAPSSANLEVGPGPRVRLSAPRPGQLHIPEVDTTFRSVAATCGPAAVGVLLTGMGRDGAAGLLAMRGRGAFTIGQDEASSAVWGMPGAARALQAVGVELALGEIGPRVGIAVRAIGEADPS